MSVPLCVSAVMTQIEVSADYLSPQQQSLKMVKTARTYCAPHIPDYTWLVQKVLIDAGLKDSTVQQPKWYLDENNRFWLILQR